MSNMPDFTISEKLTGSLARIYALDPPEIERLRIGVYPCPIGGVEG